jgi:uncharacterized membrane protein YukC
MEDRTDLIKTLKNLVSDLEKGAEIEGVAENIAKAMAAASARGCFNNDKILLAEIKREVEIIEDAVLSEQFGLQEIKCEVRSIEEKVDEIEDILEDPNFGLQEIKCEVRAIEDKLDRIEKKLDKKDHDDKKKDSCW